MNLGICNNEDRPGLIQSSSQDHEGVSQHDLHCDLENLCQWMKRLYLRNFPFC